MSQETNQGHSQVSRAFRQLFDYLRDKSRLRLALFITPPLFVLTVFFIIPLISMFWLSFQTELPPGAELTLQNYQRLTNSVYLRIIWRSLVLTIQSTAVVVILGYSFTYSIVRFSTRTTILLLLVVITFWTNYIIRMYSWINILQNGGVIDFILGSLNVIQQPEGYLYTHSAVLIGFVYIWLPLAILPFYASLTNMDEDLIEAAMDLGSGPIKSFFTVTLPLTKGGIIAGIILVAIPTFGSFITPRLLGGTNVTMIGMIIEQQFNKAFNWPFGATIGIFLSAAVIALLVISVKVGGDLYSIGGET